MGEVVQFPRAPRSAAQDDTSPMDVGENVENRSADRSLPVSRAYRRARFWGAFYTGVFLVVGWWPLAIWTALIAYVANRRMKNGY